MPKITMVSSLRSISIRSKFGLFARPNSCVCVLSVLKSVVFVFVRGMMHVHFCISLFLLSISVSALQFCIEQSALQFCLGQGGSQFCLGQSALQFCPEQSALQLSA